VKQVIITGTTLFRIASEQLGDATLWDKIADLNKLLDPVITNVQAVVLPVGASLTPGSSSD
jgi:hypothetical protein